MDWFKRKRRCECGNDVCVRGMCKKCYGKERWKNQTPEQREARRAYQRERQNNKWANDPEFRERKNQSKQKYRENNRQKTRDSWNKWAKNNPDKFHKSMARYHLKQITQKDRTSLMKELKGTLRKLEG